MKDPLTALEAISKMNQTFERLSESPFEKLVRSQSNMFKGLDSFSQIGESMDAMRKFTSMDSLFEKNSAFERMSAMDSVLKGSAFNRIESLDGITAMIDTVNRNQKLYGSFLQVANLNNSIFDVVNPGFLAAHALPKSPIFEPQVFSKIAQVSDLLIGNAFKNLVRSGDKDDIQEFQPLAEAISLDEELTTRVNKLAELVLDTTEGQEPNNHARDVFEYIHELALVFSNKIPWATPSNIMKYLGYLVTIIQLTKWAIDFAEKTTNPDSAKSEAQVNQAIGGQNGGIQPIIPVFEFALFDVHLRSLSRKDSKSIHIIMSGQIVQVIEKRRVWMKVSIQNLGNGENLVGWVNVDSFTAFK